MSNGPAIFDIGPATILDCGQLADPVLVAASLLAKAKAAARETYKYIDFADPAGTR